MWGRIKSFFMDSETIFWARLQVLAGAAAGLVAFFDPSLLAPILPTEWMPWAIFANGVATEYLRRRRANLQ